MSNKVSTQPFWAMVVLVLGVLIINAALGDGTVSTLAVVEFYACVAVAMVVSWRDLAGRGREPRLRLSVALGLAAFPFFGFFIWWSWGIEGHLPGAGSGSAPA